MDIQELFNLQDEYSFGFEYIPSQHLPITEVYVWRYILVMNPILYVLLSQYIGEEAEDFNRHLHKDVESTLLADVTVYDVGVLHYSHVNNPTVVSLVSEFIENKRQEVLTPVQSVH